MRLSETHILLKCFPKPHLRAFRRSETRNETRLPSIIAFQLGGVKHPLK